MAGKAFAALLVVAALLASAALAFLYFSPGENADAVTYDSDTGFVLSCDVDNDNDESCTPGTENNGLVTADIAQQFIVPAFVPRHSNFAQVTTTTAPNAWWLAQDSDLPDGASVGTVVSAVTLALLGGPCTQGLAVNIPLYDCSTDNSPGNQIAYIGGGENMTLDTDANGLPQGCDQYPAFVDSALAGVKPRARYFGWGNVVAGAPPSFLNFVVFGPEQVTQIPGATADMGDAMGYVNYVFLNDPNAPATPTSISEFCSPLSTSSELLGLTQGEGETIPTVGANPEDSVQCYPPNVGVDNDADGTADDGCFVITDKCTDGAGNPDGVDNDGDTAVDELCDLVRAHNPDPSNPDTDGLDNSYLAYGYTQSNRDVDGDTIANNEDECPYQVDLGVDSDGDKIDDVCDPTNNPGSIDEDGDNLDNQVDLCPLIDDRESTCNEAPASCSDADGQPPWDNCDDDVDGYINDGCAASGAAEDNVLECGDNVDDDSDTVVNDGCQTVGEPDAEAATDDGPDGDGIGDACDTSTGTADGNFIKVMPVGAACVGAADGDGDGWCDTTETNLGSNPASSASEPENYAIDYPVDPAPQTCDDLTHYTEPPPGTGTPVDNDADGSSNAGETNNDCVCPATDQDCDGVDDNPGPDNCPGASPGLDSNPTQLDTDGDGIGDACDSDDDGDNVGGAPWSYTAPDTSDQSEWSEGDDPKDPCDPRNFDNTGDGNINILDVLAYKIKLSPAPYDAAYDVNYDSTVNILDVLAYKPVLGKSCLK